jgi:hypothetical protein
MSSGNVAGLIPDRDSDSSDDEFLDALDKIENEPEPEYEDNVNTGSCNALYSVVCCISFAFQTL